MKITAVSVTNFKRLDHIEITPEADRALILIAGKNAMGKSSLMDALTAAFGGKGALPADPVKHGAESAEIRVELDGGALVVKRTIKDGESVLELRDADGKLASPQARLDKLVGARFLDPLAFLSLSPADQRKALLALIDKDGAIAALDGKRTMVFQTRTEASRDHKRMTAQLAGIAAVTPGAVVDVSAITAEAQAIEAQARARQDLQHRHEQSKRILADQVAKIERLEVQIADLAAQLELAEQALDADKERLEQTGAALAAVPDEDLDAVRASLRKRIQDAANHNHNVAADLAQAKRRAELAAEVEKMGEVIEKHTAAIEKIDADKAAFLAATKLPVEGLDVDPAGVRFNGVPLSQASGAEQLRVALALAIAANPNLRDVWVREGEKLDDDSLALLAAAAEKAGVRCWVERVGDRDPGAIVIHDGRIRPEAARAAS